METFMAVEFRSCDSTAANIYLSCLKYSGPNLTLSQRFFALKSVKSPQNRLDQGPSDDKF